MNRLQKEIRDRVILFRQARGEDEMKKAWGDLQRILQVGKSLWKKDLQFGKRLNLPKEIEFKGGGEATPIITLGSQGLCVTRVRKHNSVSSDVQWKLREKFLRNMPPNPFFAKLYGSGVDHEGNIFHRMQFIPGNRCASRADSTRNSKKSNLLITQVVGKQYCMLDQTPKNTIRDLRSGALVYVDFLIYNKLRKPGQRSCR